MHSTKKIKAIMPRICWKTIAAAVALWGAPFFLHALDISSPTVRITDPLNGAKISGTVIVKTTAADNVGVTRVEFFQASALQHTASAPPYNWTWNTRSLPNMLYPLRAVAHDAAGHSKISFVINADVNNSSPNRGEFYDNFEAGTFEKWQKSVVDQDVFQGPKNNLVAVSTAAAFEGTKGLRVRTSGQDGAFVTAAIEPADRLFARLRFRLINPIPDDASGKQILYNGVARLNIHSKSGAGYTNRFFLLIPGAGNLDTGVTAQMNRWYCLELFTQLGSTIAAAAVRIDGVEVARKEFTAGAAFMDFLDVGAKGPNDNVEYHVDDMATSRNRWVGTGPFLPDSGPLRYGGGPLGPIPQATPSVTLRVLTEVPATCRYDALTGKSYDQMTGLFTSTDGVTHARLLTGLAAGQAYEYSVRCRAAQTGAVNLADYPIAFRLRTDGVTLTKIETVPTYQNVSVYATFAGDENQNGRGFLEWRKKGASAWRRGMDTTPDHRPVVTGQSHTYANAWINQHRASLIGLEAGQTYEVRATLVDPDSAAGPQSLTAEVKTWAESYPAPGRRFHVAPTGSDAHPGTEAQPLRTIQAAVNQAQPGDTVLVAPGAYPEMVTVSRKTGAADRYLVIQAAGGDTKPVMDGAGQTPVGFFVQQSKFVVLRGFDIRNSPAGMVSTIHVVDSSDIVVEENDVYNFASRGIRMFGSGRVTLQNNRITKTTAGILGKLMDFKNSAPGNHVIRRNRFIDATGLPHTVNPSVYWDCLGGESNWSLDGFVGNDSDIYGNYFEGCSDDQIEMEGGMANVRVYENVMNAGANGYHAIAAAPIIVGPVYIFRNVMYGFQNGLVKQGQTSTGHQYFYHNTYIPSLTSARLSNGFSQENPGVLYNVTSRNNIVRARRYIIEYMGGSAFNDTFDHDCLYTSGTSEPTPFFIKWADVKIPSLEAFQNQTGNERNGVYIDPLGELVDPAAGNLRLKTGSVLIDKGQLLYGFNDADSPWPYRGAAPDIGAYELGADAPDTTPPVISNIALAGLASDGVDVSWTTNEPSLGRVDFGTTTAYGRTAATFMNTVHSVRLSGLLPATTYHYRVHAAGAAGNNATSADRSFVTPPASAKKCDLSGDGRVDITDLSLFLSRWLSTDAAADFNKSGTVEVGDLSLLLTNWDATPLSNPAFGAPAQRGRGTAAFILSPRARKTAADPLVVDLLLDAPQPVNAVQVSLSFPMEKLEMSEIDTTNSAFSLAAPEFARPGALVLARGHLTPLSGRLHVARLVFRSVAPGTAALSFRQGSMALRSGDASDVLTVAKGIDVSDQPASQTFLTPGTADGINDAIIFDDDVTEVSIMDMNGRKIYEASSEAGAALSWDGRNNGGLAVPSGSYIAKLKKADESNEYRTIILAK